MASGHLHNLTSEAFFMKRILLCSTLLMGASSTAALAGDWTGWYAGGQIGYSYGEFDLNSVTTPGDFDADGVIGGFMGGYLQDYGDWVAGVELQYDFSDISFNEASGSGSFDGIARLKARAGRDFGNSLGFISVGVVYTNFDGVTGVTDIDFDDPGVVAGVGYEYQINQNWVVGGEYMWHQFLDFGADGNDVTFNTLHVRASYRF